jgi:uncharacterized protein
MKPRLTVLTLGVDDLERAVAFYRDGLGFPTEGIVGREFEHGAVAFFDLESGLKLALWPRTSIAHDTGLAERERSATELTLGHNVESRAAVDAVMTDAERAGARDVLGRILGVLPGSGRASVGGRLESTVVGASVGVPLFLARWRRSPIETVARSPTFSHGHSGCGRETIQSPMRKQR